MNLHLSTTYHDYWCFIGCWWHKFLYFGSFCAIFWPFYLNSRQKIKVLKNPKKNPLENINSDLSTKIYNYWMFRWIHIASDMKYVILGHFLNFLYHQHMVKLKFSKSQKSTLGKLSICLCTKCLYYWIFCWELITMMMHHHDNHWWLSAFWVTLEQFRPFYPHTRWKNRNFQKKGKKLLENMNSHLYITIYDYWILHCLVTCSGWHTDR